MRKIPRWLSDVAAREMEDMPQDWHPKICMIAEAVDVNGKKIELGFVLDRESEDEIKGKKTHPLILSLRQAIWQMLEFERIRAKHRPPSKAA